MKKILLIVLVILLLGGIGAGASIYLQVGPLATLMKPKEPEKPPPPPPPPEHKLINVSSFSVPVIQDHGIGRSLGLDIALDVLASDEPKVTALMPKLLNAYTLTLYDIVPVHSDAHSPADKKFIHDRLMQVTDRIAGKGVVQDVVIRSIYDR